MAPVTPCSTLPVGYLLLFQTHSSVTSCFPTPTRWLPFPILHSHIGDLFQSQTHLAALPSLLIHLLPHSTSDPPVGDLAWQPLRPERLQQPCQPPLELVGLAGVASSSDDGHLHMGRGVMMHHDIRLFSQEAAKQGIEGLPWVASSSDDGYMVMMSWCC